MQASIVLKRMFSKLLWKTWTYVWVILFFTLLFFYSQSFIYKIVLLLGIPYLIRLAYYGYPLGYYKMTGRRYEFDLSEAHKVEKDQYYEITDIGETSYKQLLTQLVFALVVATLIFHIYTTILKDLFSEVWSIVRMVFTQLRSSG